MGQGSEDPRGPADAPWQQPGTGAPEPHRWSAPAPAGPEPAPGTGAPAGGAAGGAGWSGQRAPLPGIVPLRPLGLGEIYDGAFRAFRQNPRVMVGLSAVVVTATTLLTLVPISVLSSDLAGFGAAVETSGEFPVEGLTSLLTRSAPVVVVTSVLQYVGQVLLNGLLIVAVSRAVLGERVGLGQLWRSARARVPALLLLALLLTLVALLLLVLAVGPGIALLVAEQVAAGVVVLVLGVLGALAVGLWLFVRWSLAAPALLLEGAGVTAAMRRSARLVRGSSWRVLGILLLTSLIAYAVTMAIGMPFTLVVGVVAGFAAAAGSEPTTGAFLLQNGIASLGTIAASAVAYPFVASVTALLYIDLRMRREGLDVELHRAAAGTAPPERW